MRFTPPSKWLWEERINSVTGGKIVRNIQVKFHKGSHFEVWIYIFFKKVSCFLTLWIDFKWPSQGGTFQVKGSVQFSSVAQSCLTLCDPMNRSTPGLPVHHQLPEFTQIHVHRVSNAIHPSHPHVQKTEEWSSVCKVCVRRATNWSFFCTQ